MVKVDVSVIINRSAEEVWAYLDDPSNWPEWNATVLEAKASDRPLRVGTTVESVAKFLGRRITSTFEITEYEPGRKVVSRTTAPFPLTQTYIVEPAAGRARVSGTLEGEPGGFFKLGEPILARIAKKQVDSQFETLKEILEARVPAATRT